MFIVLLPITGQKIPKFALLLYPTISNIVRRPNWIAEMNYTCNLRSYMGRRYYNCNNCNAYYPLDGQFCAITNKFVSVSLKW